MSDPFRLVTPDGRWAIEVTESEEEGFIGQVVLDGTHVLESISSEDSDRLIRWAVKQMFQVMRRNGG